MGTQKTCEQLDAIMPATPLAIAAFVGSDNLKGSTISKAKTFDLSNAKANNILAGIDPVIIVPKPL